MGRLQASKYCPCNIYFALFSITINKQRPPKDFHFSPIVKKKKKNVKQIDNPGCSFCRETAARGTSTVIDLLQNSDEVVLYFCKAFIHKAEVFLFVVPESTTDTMILKCSMNISQPIDLGRIVGEINGAVFSAV